MATNDLGGHEDNAEGNDGLDRRSRDMHESEGRQRQRDTVGERKRRDGAHQLLPSLHDQEKGEHEEEVVDSKEDVLDAEDEVSP